MVARNSSILMLSATQKRSAATLPACGAGGRERLTGFGIGSAYRELMQRVRMGRMRRGDFIISCFVVMVIIESIINA